MGQLKIAGCQWTIGCNAASRCWAVERTRERDRHTERAREIRKRGAATAKPEKSVDTNKGGSRRTRAPRKTALLPGSVRGAGRFSYFLSSLSILSRSAERQRETGRLAPVRRKIERTVVVLTNRHLRAAIRAGVGRGDAFQMRGALLGSSGSSGSS